MDAGLSAARRQIERTAEPEELTSGDLGWSLQLLRSTNLEISLFRLRLRGAMGPHANIGRAFEALLQQFAAQGIVSRLNDGSVLFLLIRSGETEAEASGRVATQLWRAMRLSDWPSHTVVEMYAVHHHTAEIGHITDVLAELVYAPRRVIGLELANRLAEAASR